MTNLTLALSVQPIRHSLSVYVGGPCADEKLWLFFYVFSALKVIDGTVSQAHRSSLRMIPDGL